MATCANMLVQVDEHTSQDNGEPPDVRRPISKGSTTLTPVHLKNAGSILAFKGILYINVAICSIAHDFNLNRIILSKLKTDIKRKVPKLHQKSTPAFPPETRRHVSPNVPNVSNLPCTPDVYKKLLLPLREEGAYRAVKRGSCATWFICILINCMEIPYKVANS